MKLLSLVFLLVLWPLPLRADTPPAGTIKARMYSGDGDIPITTTGSALNVNVTNSGGLSTVSQGDAGSQSWLVSVTGSALPTNACQETGGHLASIDTKLTSPLTVAGTFWQATQPVSVASLPLPAGAATQATLATINGKLPALGQALAASSLPVVLTASQLSTLTPLSSVTANAGSGTFLVDGSAHTQPVSASSLPLPSGAATESTLTNIDGILNSIDSKTPSLGQALSAGSVPVVLTASQVSTLTPPTTITANAGSGTFTVDGSGHTQPISGTVTSNAGTGTFLVDASAHPQPVTGTFWQATQPVSGTFWQATQPVSASSLPLPSGAATETTLSGVDTSVSSIDSKTPALGQALAAASVPVVLTASQLSTLTPVSTVTANAGTGTFSVDGSGHTQPVSGTFWQTTQPVSLATLPALAAGSAVIGKVAIDQTTPGTTNLVALAANQSVNVAQINGVTPLMGNGTAGTGAQRVTIASDNTAFSVNAIPKTPAALTVKQAAISVGTSAVRLTNDGSAPPSTRTLLVAQLISTSTANCYFGSSGVTTTSTTRGVQMFAGQTLSFNNDAGDYYAICDASSQTILITEQE